MIDDNKVFSRILSCIDIIAMFMILFYHSANYIDMIRPGSMDKSMAMLVALFVVFGLTAFTYSSGFKLSFNHYKDLEDNKFYRKYIRQRTISLYGNYLLYPVITTIVLYTLYFIFCFIGKQAIILPFFQQVCAINSNNVFSILINFLFFGLPPAGGQLWYIFVLLIINLTVLIAMRLYGIRPILTGFFPLLLLYFIFNYHILGPISPTELRYYVCIYMVIFLSGTSMGYLYHNNRIIFYKTLFSFVGIFLMVMIGYFTVDVMNKSFPNNHIFNLLYGNLFYSNLFFRYGLTFPIFLMASLFLLRNTKFVSALSAYRKYILLIFMLQYPFTIPFFSRLLSKIGFYNLGITWVSPLLVSFLSIITCIMIYKIYKNTFNLLSNRKTININMSIQ